MAIFSLPGVGNLFLSEHVFQLVVGVYDQGEPSLSDFEIILLTVQSNFDTPRFLQAQSRTVLETFNTSLELFTMVAEDNDPVSISLLSLFRMITSGHVNQFWPDFFSFWRCSGVK